jgi:hypothetical protein
LKTRKNSRGLSVVVSTLILLVVSVLLATLDSYYATNVMRARSNMEEVHYSDERIWANDTGAVAAFKLHNTGGRDILINRLTVRGVESEWGNVYFYRVPIDSSVLGEMNVTSYDNLVGNNVTIDGRLYEIAYTPLTLVSSGVIMFYVKGPRNVQTEDVGKIVSISLCTNNANYITEASVESATKQ